MHKVFAIACVVAALISGPVAPGHAAGRGPAPKSSANITVDKTATGVYKALAQLSFQAFAEKKNALALVYAEILEKTWDRSSKDLGKPEAADDIDEAMDGFIESVKTPDENDPDGYAQKMLTSYLATLKSGN